MSNERLRAAIAGAGLTTQTFSEMVAVDPKTVERWIAADRLPHRSHRIRASEILRKSDGFLWPATHSDRASTSSTQAELVHIYPSRSAIEPPTWLELVAQAKERIDVLAYAAQLPARQHPGVHEQAGRQVAPRGAGAAASSATPTGKPSTCAAGKRASASSWLRAASSPGST